MFDPKYNNDIIALADKYSNRSITKDGDIADIVNLGSMLSLDTILGVTYTANPVYWEFLYEVLKNIVSGKWNMHPSMWGSYIKGQEPMPEIDIANSTDLYRKSIKIMLSKLNLKSGNTDANVAVFWLSHENGPEDMLAAMSFIARLNK